MHLRRFAVVIFVTMFSLPGESAKCINLLAFVKLNKLIHRFSNDDSVIAQSVKSSVEAAFRGLVKSENINCLFNGC